jgi:alanine transaminase
MGSLSEVNGSIQRAKTYNKSLTIETINPSVLAAQYAVRGELAIRANVLTEELKKGNQYPFKNVVHCEIGNPQALDQKPLTFIRQVHPHDGPN